MRIRSFFIDAPQLHGDDAAIYRERAQQRDRIVLRLIAALMIVGQVTRLLLDWNVVPELVQSGLPYRIGGLVCFLALFAASFHRVTASHLHAVIGAGFLMGSASLVKAFVGTIGQPQPVMTGLVVAFFLFSPLSFRRPLVIFIAAMAAVVATVHMPLAGLGDLGIAARLAIMGAVAATSLLASSLFERYWRRAFLMERNLARSHEDLRRTHHELAEAYATLKATQAQLVKAEKTAALGRLVAGVAHRLNTPVGALVGTASHLADCSEEFSRSMAKDRSVRRSDLARYVAMVAETSALVLDNARQTARIVDAFKHLEASAEPVAAMDIGAFLTGIQASLQASTPPGVTVLVEAPAGLAVLATPSLLETIVHQTVCNAVQHAFPDGGTGTVVVRACADPEGGTTLTVTDDGCGIPAEHLDHVFDPFYTDGHIGGGRGLGLSIVHSAVAGPLGGRIAIESRKEGGTIVTIRLPAAEHAPDGPPMDAELAPERC